MKSDALYLFLKVFYVYLSKIYTETTEISKQEDCEFCAWASHFIMNYKITVKCSEGKIFSRMPNMQVLCPCYARHHIN